MSDRVLAGLDLGCESVKCVVGELDDDGVLQITGAGRAPSGGAVREGVVVDLQGAVEAVTEAMEEAESISSWEVTRVAVAVSGAHVRGFPGTGTVNVEREDDLEPGEITLEDVESAIEAAEMVKLPRDSMVLRTIRCGFSIDDFDRLDRPPVGLRAERITADTYMVTADRTAISNLEKVVRMAGRRVSGIHPAANAGARAVITRDEAEMGVVFLDIGAGTTDVAVMSGGSLVHVGVVPCGGALMTRDLQAMRISWEEAERLKVGFADLASGPGAGSRAMEVRTLGGRDTVPVTADVISQIVFSRAQQLFEDVLEELRQTGLQPADLPAGIVLTGGTSRLAGLSGAASHTIGLPSERGAPSGVEMSSPLTAEPEFSVAVGLVMLEHEDEMSDRRRRRPNLLGDLAAGLKGMIRRMR